MELHIISKGERVCSYRNGDENKNSLIFLWFYAFGDVMGNRVISNGQFLRFTATDVNLLKNACAVLF